MRILECFTRTIRWVPSVFVTGVVLWSYYAYVVELCIMTVQINWERIVYLTLYHPILFLFVWSYWQTVFTDPLHPRQEYFLTVEEVHKVSILIKPNAFQKDIKLSIGIHQSGSYDMWVNRVGDFISGNFISFRDASDVSFYLGSRLRFFHVRLRIFNPSSNQAHDSYCMTHTV